VTAAAVCISGIGVASPQGHSYREFADNLLAGRSFVRRVARFAVDDQPAQIGAELTKFPCPAELDAAWFATLTRLDQAALWCTVQALVDAGHWSNRASQRIGIVLGCASEWHTIWGDDYLTGGRMVFEPQAHSLPLVHRLRRWLELTGPAVSLSAACASGNCALALARRWLQLGWVDVCLAGALDLALTPITLAGFGNLRALSRAGGDPTTASRPFDVDRDGFVIAEGGALFVLERSTDAGARSATIYAEVAGCGASSDAHHMVIPSPDPTAAIAAVRSALDDARVNRDEINYVNAHATGTPVGDQAEARVLATVFADHTQHLPVSSTKGTTGHLLTGAAALEALACIVALQQQAVPPTINLHRPDPECPLRHVPNEAEPHRLRVVLSNSFGFGGSNTCLVLRAA
jgi:3-oxoacyl-[acyl-carrier-protein] synthase II